MANYVLEILDGDRAGEVLAVAAAAIRIGRKPGNDLVLADEKTSGVHAEVVAEGDRHVLRDLGSTNGTFLDGKRVTEIVLTPGDIVTVGRLRVCFREEGAAASADAGELAVRRLDAGRVKRRSGVGVLVAVLLVGLGGAGWFWWQGQQKQESQHTGPTKKPPLAVANNRLAANIAACDGEDGWNLRAAGAGFQTTLVGHTGVGAFQALRDSAPASPDFAVMQLAEPLSVFGNRTMTVAAHLRASGGAEIAVRAVAFSSSDQVPFHFRTGSTLESHDEWQRAEAIVPIPVGCDRLQVEIVALLPAADSVAMVDDVAVTEAGQQAPLELTLAESSQTALGSGSALAVRSTDANNPATLLAVLPDQVPAKLKALQEAELLALSDLGATLSCKAGERSFELAATNVDSLQFVFPADAAGSMLVQNGDEGFGSKAAESEFPATCVLLGDRGTRAMLRFAQPVTCRGHLGGGYYRLAVASNQAELVLGFRSEQKQANEALVRARSSRQEGHYGQALDTLRELTQRLPMDSEILGQAQQMRAEILQRQADSVAQLTKDLNEAMFFKTRGGFERVVGGVDELVALYGEQNIEDAAATKLLRASAAERLAQFDAEQYGAQRERLTRLASALTEGGQEGLAALVTEYVAHHIPAAPSTSDGNSPEKPH